MESQLKYLAKNKPIRMAYILEKAEITAEDLKAIDYRIHRPEKCACQCVRFEFSTTKENVKKVKSLFDSSGYSETQIEEANEEHICRFTISSLSIRNKFHNLYRNNMPTVLEYYKPKEKESEVVNLFLYKEGNNQEVIIKHILKDMCKFTRDNKTSISEALLIQKVNSIWYIEGVGCSCSTFKPIEPSHIDKDKVLAQMKKF